MFRWRKYDNATSEQARVQRIGAGSYQGERCCVEHRNENEGAILGAHGQQANTVKHRADHRSDWRKEAQAEHNGQGDRKNQRRVGDWRRQLLVST